MGFEATLIPPPPGATFKRKIPEIRLTEGSTVDIDDEYGVEDFVAKIAAISDHGPDLMDEYKFCGFCRSVHAAMNIEEGKVEGKEVKEENGLLYRMEVLISEADTLMSSPSKVSDNFLPSGDQYDHEHTPIARKIAVKGKGKVMGKGRQVRV